MTNMLYVHEQESEFSLTKGDRGCYGIATNNILDVKNY